MYIQHTPYFSIWFIQRYKKILAVLFDNISIGTCLPNKVNIINKKINSGFIFKGYTVISEYDIDDMQGVSLGAGLFWKKIIPKVQEAITVVGCRYLYLFAADNSDYEETRSLIRYYKDDFKFDELQDLMIIKSDYDRRCQAMIQDVSEIERDEYTFWARYKKDN